MPRTLLTFLGTNKYIRCKYCFNEHESIVVTYVQQAMAEIFCGNWTKEDRILVLLTEEARQTHWNTLSRQLSDHVTIETVDIPDGLSEEQIWQIFSLIFEKLRVGGPFVPDDTPADTLRAALYPARSGVSPMVRPLAIG